MEMPLGQPKTKHSVIVLGAGVIGLQCALTLRQRGYDVHVVAKHLPGDVSIEYTSPWAGAHWRPHGLGHDVQQCRWDMESYRDWINIVAEEARLNVPVEARSGISVSQSTLAVIAAFQSDGVQIVPSLLMWDSPQHAELQPSGDASSLWFAREADEFHVCAAPGHAAGIASAARFTALTINVPKYLKYLQHQLSILGGQCTQFAAPTEQGFDVALEDICRKIRAPSNAFIINATGMGARHLVPDNLVYPARGQVVLVRGVAPECRTRQGESYISYVIPRPDAGTSILGGCKEVGNWDGEEDTSMTEKILERARTLVPELLNEKGEFEVLSVQVGLRPGREGGARVEREVRKDGRVMVHSYGHGGAGYQNSVGVANTVLSLIEDESLRASKL
ncbi:MAG: hypothetical protein M1828_000977 [Chrysothrix sp. TS-e1954]|nr:MAG: hypothetical protein M1828_000977 [Chrysothrix sp. TS-e1954]